MWWERTGWHEHWREKQAVSGNCRPKRELETVSGRFAFRWARVDATAQPARVPDKQPTILRHVRAVVERSDSGASESPRTSQCPMITILGAQSTHRVSPEKAQKMPTRSLVLFLQMDEHDSMLPLNINGLRKQTRHKDCVKSGYISFIGCLRNTPCRIFRRSTWLMNRFMQRLFNFISFVRFSLSIIGTSIYSLGERVGTHREELWTSDPDFFLPVWSYIILHFLLLIFNYIYDDKMSIMASFFFKRCVYVIVF